MSGLTPQKITAAIDVLTSVAAETPLSAGIHDRLGDLCELAAYS